MLNNLTPFNKLIKKLFVSLSKIKHLKNTIMKNLAKNTVYVVVIHKGADSFNTYSKVVNAYKITAAKRTYLNVDNCRLSLHTDGTQVAREYLTSIGFILPTYMSEAQNIVVIEHNVKYRDLKNS